MNVEVRNLPQRRGARFFALLAVVSAAIVFVGFAPTFYLNSFMAHRHLDPMRIAHGTVFSIWLLLLLAQTTLVSAGRTDVHRRLGVAGGVLAGMMVTLGVAMAIHGARHGLQTPGLPPPPVFLVVPLFDMAVFAALIGAGLYWRRRPEIHKRLMIMATLSILPAAFARLPLPVIGDPLLQAFGLGDVLLLACIAWDVAVQRRLHRVWVWGAALIILSLPLRLFVAGTAGWMAFANRLIG